MSDEGGKKSSLMKKLIMGVLALVALGGATYGGILIAGKMAAKKAAAAGEAAKPPEAKDDKAAKEAEAHKGSDAHGEEEEEEAGGHGGAAASPTVLVLKPIVNLESPRKNSFLKCELHILFRDAELGKLASGDKPTLENSSVRAIILEMLSGKTLEEARDLEFRESLRQEIKERLNQKFAPKPPKPGEKEDPKTKKPKRPVKDVLVVDWAIQE